MTRSITPKDREKTYREKRSRYKNLPNHPEGMYNLKIRLERYDRMLYKYATVPGHISFYCRPSDKNDIPLYLGNDDFEYIHNCPRCAAIMEEYMVERGCGYIAAYYCKKDNLHWVYDCYGWPSPHRWYGPFEDHPKNVVSIFLFSERSAELELERKSRGKENKIVIVVKNIKNKMMKKLR